MVHAVIKATSAQEAGGAGLSAAVDDNEEDFGDGGGITQYVQGH